FSEPFFSCTVLDPTIGSAGFTKTPGSGRIAASGSYSRGLFALKGWAADSCCAPAIFAVRSSGESTSGCGSAGPETVARLLGSRGDGGPGRVFLDLAM